VIGPGRDTNYPTSSGDATRGIMARVNGYHVTFGMIALILLVLIIWNATKRRR
jgi:hypothetical protein